MLQDKEMLQFCFTLNFDNMEEKVGLKLERKVRHAYGANTGAVCSKCGDEADGEELAKNIKSGQVMRCKECEGPIKPKIIFYGEKLDNNFTDVWDFLEDEAMGSLRQAMKASVLKMKNDLEKIRQEIRNVGEDEADKKDFVPDVLHNYPEPELVDGGGCDLLLILGPSMNQQPFCQIAGKTTKGCPQVYINTQNNIFNPCYDFHDLKNHPNRLFLQGKPEDVLSQLIKDIEWEKEYEEMKR